MERTSIVDVKKWLINSLKPYIDTDHYATFNGQPWCLQSIFQNGFNYYQVLYNKATDQYGFHVEPRFYTGEREPSMGIYDSWDSLIHGVAKRYVDVWNIALP